MALASIKDIIADIKAGKFIILVDDEDRENEGDFIIAAEKITPDAVNFMTKHGRGLICMRTVFSEYPGMRELPEFMAYHVLCHKDRYKALSVVY